MVDVATVVPTTNKSMSSTILPTRGYQQEMLNVSLSQNIIIALDTGSGKTHIAILRIKHEIERDPSKVCWFIAPTVALCQQQHAVISSYLPISVGLVSGSHYPDQWKNANLWKMVIDTHQVVVSTPQVLLDALRHGYLNLGGHIGLVVFDEAHHAVDKHPYNMIMREFYFGLPTRGEGGTVLCRPMIMGLSASPIYGSGDVDKAFKTIEKNLDSLICTPHYHRDELARFVHQPIFKHAPFFSHDPSNPAFSTNLAALQGVIASLNIENDPYVRTLRRQLAKASSNPASREYHRIDQKLSKVIANQDSFTHKGLRDLERAATDILFSIGSWAADWFIHAVVTNVKHHASTNPFGNAMVLTSSSAPGAATLLGSWKSAEKKYLGSVLGGLVTSPTSYFEEDIVDECSGKVNVLIQCLLDEKEFAEAGGEAYSGLVFVQRRDAVIALAHLLAHHPATKDQFRIGTLLGTSESAQRHSMMDITRILSTNSPPTSSSSQVGDGAPTSQPSSKPKRPSPQTSSAATLADFRIGEKNLIISTSVAEEGIDIQACGSVIRWDPPQNMASWVQSRGRARRQRSTFTLMYDVDEDKAQGNVEKWKSMEEKMREKARGDMGGVGLERVVEAGDEEEGDWDMELRNDETGATINPHSAASHLSHFCAVISRAGGEETRPIYDIDPPDYTLGWHSSVATDSSHPFPVMPLYQGPWSSTVTLPRSLPIPQRTFTTERIYSSKLAAHRHAAFKAYEALHGWELLNDNLLPFTHGGKDVEGEEDVKRILRDIERREGMSKVGVQVDPWAVLDREEGVELGVGGEQEPGIGEGRDVRRTEAVKRWYLSELTIDGLPMLLFFSLRPMVKVERDDGPKLYRSGHPVIRAQIVPVYNDPHYMPTTTAAYPDARGHNDDPSYYKTILDNDPIIENARAYSKMIFWCFYGSKLKWDDANYAYLFIPVDDTTNIRPNIWAERRRWLEAEHRVGNARSDRRFLVEAQAFTEKWGYTNDITIVRKYLSFGKGLRFVGWQSDRLGEEEEEAVRQEYRSKRVNGKAKAKEGKDENGAGGVLGEIDRNRTEALNGTSISKDVEMQDVEEVKLDIPYPLLIVESFPPRSNFLHPLPDGTTKRKRNDPEIEKVPYRSYLIPNLSGIALYSPEETEYAFLMPSVLRWLGNHLTIVSFQRQHFSSSAIPSSPSSPPLDLLSIPPSLLTVALTAPVSGERYNYQRLETLGDAVLKYVVGVQLFAEFPMWHEGYLTRGKDHAVSNVKLAKENCKREVFRWIIRDMMPGRKWLPKHITSAVVEDVATGGEGGVGADANTSSAGSANAEKAENIPVEATEAVTLKVVPVTENKDQEGEAKVDGEPKTKKKGRKRGKGKATGTSQQLSTKILADVVESLIGAAYEHGGFNLGYECTKFFDLGVKWQPLPARINQILSNVRTDDNLDIEIPPQISDVERMIGYTFNRKILLIEALTHASYRELVATSSYERLEFLGDGILDMIVTDYLYHAPGGKEYSPGHMHIRKSAVVNGHFLAYICLGLKHTYDAVIPQPAPGAAPDEEGDVWRNPYTARMDFVAGVDRQEINLWQCLLHSNQQVLDDQVNTFTRYGHRKEEIQEALESGFIFPWAALTRLQAPKLLSDIVESIIGAVYLDSRGDMDVVKGVLRGIGILPVLERIVRDDMDVFHPVSRLAMWGAKNEKKIEYVFEKKRGNVACIIKVDGVEEVRETEIFRGKSSQEEVKFAAAERAINQFKLRGTGQNSSDFGSKKGSVLKGKTNET